MNNNKKQNKTNRFQAKHKTQTIPNKTQNTKYSSYFGAKNYFVAHSHQSHHTWPRKILPLSWRVSRQPHPGTILPARASAGLTRPAPAPFLPKESAYVHIKNQGTFCIYCTCKGLGGTDWSSLIILGVSRRRLKSVKIFVFIRLRAPYFTTFFCCRSGERGFQDAGMEAGGGRGYGSSVDRKLTDRIHVFCSTGGAS